MNMPLPPGAVTDPQTNANEVDENENDSDKASASAAIKQFGPATDADGNIVPVPTVDGVDCVELVNKMYSALASALVDKGITDVEGWIDSAEAIDKTTFPGSKLGRVAYNGIRAFANIFKQHALLNKQRGTGGVAALKSKLAEKDAAIEALQKQMAELMAKLKG